VTNPSILMALQGTGGGASQMPIFLVQVVLIGLVFWFLIIRPQAQARKKHAELLGQLKKGDEVMTVGGIIGIVRDIRQVQDGKETRVTVESGTAQVVVERSRIARVGSETSAAPPPA
jgi:preprotein translocase subunit YajC